MSYSDRRKMRKGFTVLEMIVTFVLLTVFLSGVCQLVAWQGTLQRQSRRRTLALEEINHVMDQVRSRFIQGVTSEEESARMWKLSPRAQNSLPGAQLTVDIEPASDEGPNRRIFVSLTWHGANQTTLQAVHLVTWVQDSVEVTP